MANLNISNMTKSYGNTVAVDDVSFEVKDGEMLTLLGPSGCGKTTTLRVVAGLEKPEGGEVYLGDRLLCSIEKRVIVPPNKRGMGMVFQSYAVWPHMTIFENIAFPLKLQKLPMARIKEMVTQVLALVGLQDIEENRGATLLSGGQQQRVALARALVFTPEVLLLDEPLSNLDAKLRAQMRLELKSLQQRIGITCIFVTHDQLEAMVLSDRLAVMNHGKIEQLGTPRELYETPKSKFVVDFIGQANHLSGEALEDSSGGKCLVRTTKTETKTEGEVLHGVALENISQGREVTLLIRPEDITLHRQHPGERINLLSAKVKIVSYLGDQMHYVLSLGDETLDVFTPPSQKLGPWDTVFVELDPKALWVWAA